MSAEPVIARSDDPRVARLMAEGWIVTDRSWGAQLDAADADRARLRAIVDRVAGSVVLRELRPDDARRILALDAATLGDYPGGPATRHAGLDPEAARVPAPGRRGYGAFDAEADGALRAMTFVDLSPSGSAAETDVTVVEAAHRGRGLGSAVKAFSVLALLEAGITAFRTGGSSENAAIIAAGTALGYRVDEEWLTLRAPDAATRG
jgi:GNAT superfamily N-acetyltransferase